MEHERSEAEKYHQFQEAEHELKAYRMNREVFRKNQALDDTPGSKAYELLKKVAEDGGTYEDIGSSEAEIKEFFGGYVKDLFNANEHKKKSS